MSYRKLPSGTKLSSQEFIVEMNKAIATLTFYREGMLVCADECGYWLETDGVIDDVNVDLLNAASKLVLS